LGLCETCRMLKNGAVPPILSDNPACNPVCRVCHYKDFDYPSQLERKQSWAVQQLEHWSPVLQNIESAPLEERLGYRSKSWLRCSFKDGQVSFGMFRSVKVDGRWKKDFISWNTCPLHLQSIQTIVYRLRQVLSREDPEVLEQALVGVWIGSPHLVIISRDPSFKSGVMRLDWSQILVAPFDRVWFHLNSQVGRHVFGHQPIELIAGTEDTSVHPIRAFRQIAQTLLIKARSLALQAILHSKPTLVLDLYCGTGDFSLLLPSEIGWIGIELSKEAVKYANTQGTSQQRLGSPLHAAFAGAVEQRLRDPRVLSKIPESYALYLNPPRSGLTEDARRRVLALVSQKPPTAVVYLSCSASSLARDLVEFETAGYRVRFLQPYDFFPQTEHFETLAILEPRQGGLDF
jgi:23S rRNA (uracil1939-C5)-methyltransferase